jgi:cytochrome c peroxidase
MHRLMMVLVGLASCVEPSSGERIDDLPDAGDAPPSELALPLTPPSPAANPGSPAKIALGRLLFWDPILSGARTLACATCHDPRFGYSDGRQTSIGTARNAPTILDTAWNGSVLGHPIPVAEQAPMFWDNRARSLELQARGPLTASNEMLGTVFTEQTIFPELVARLSGIPAYATQFEAAFGTSGITETRILQAIAAFERTLTNPQTSYDRYVNGDTTALTVQQQRGLRVLTENHCTNCHSGPMFSDYELHELRVPDLPGAPHDPGDGANRFRTPSLRNITHTAPYMHDGVFAGFQQVFQFYLQATQNPADPKLRGVRTPTPQEAPDVIALFAALGDSPFDTSIPATVPSGLTPGGTP